MKRARHRWLAFSMAYVLLLVVQVEFCTAVRATSLTHAKATTTTTTTTAPDEKPAEEQSDKSLEDMAAEAHNSTKLSGIPQIDYVHDPNLPRELNGFNLSEYPFYETVPPLELIDFKCDGLHDGFYASIAHKCQVYHHCIDGFRHDFLCANYTAFDQKTFICQFVSVVDCKNSAKYWNRNDALYKATTSATPPPRPTTTTPLPPPAPERPARPPRRRRPQQRYEYFDDDYYYPMRDDYDYEERSSRRRPRPRPVSRPGARKRRPYDDYEDERYERRPRPRDEEEDYEERRPYERPRANGKRVNQDRRPIDDDDRPSSRPKRPILRDDEEDLERPRYKSRDEPRKEFNRDGVRTRDEVRPRDEIKPRDEVRPRDEIRTRDERPSFRNRENKRQNDRLRDDTPPKDDVRVRDERLEEVKPRESLRNRDEDKPTESRRFQDDRYRNREDREKNRAEVRDRPRPSQADTADQRPTAPESQTLVKPNGYGIFAQPRMPPKIKRPVPANEKAKFEYVPVATTKAPPKLDDEEYYDYEEDEPSKTSSSGKTSTVQARPKPAPIEKEKFKPSRPHFADRNKPKKRPVEYEDDEYYDDDPPKSQKYQTTKKPIQDDYDYAYEEERERKKPRTVKEEPDRLIPMTRDSRTNVKVIKRPFLPSRGGSPYLPRGLQLVAGKNLTSITTSTPIIISTSTQESIPAHSSESNGKRKYPDQLYDDDEYYDEEDPIPDNKNENSQPTTTVEITTTTTTTESPKTNTPEITTVAEKVTNNPEQIGISNIEALINDHADKPKVHVSNVMYTEKPSVEQQEKYERPMSYYSDQPKPYAIEPPKPYAIEQPKSYAVENPKLHTHVERPKALKTISHDDYLVMANAKLRKEHEQKAKNLADKVLKVYTDSYEKIKGKLESTLQPGDYLKSYLETEMAQPIPDDLLETPQKHTIPEIKPIEIKPDISQLYTKPVDIKPDISQPYTATGKPVIPENISIKQNLADSYENEYDVRLNEASPVLTKVPNTRNIPSGFHMPVDRDYSYSRFRNAFPAEPQYAASDISNYRLRTQPQINVSLRTPQSFYIQPHPRLNPGYKSEEVGQHRFLRHVVYRDAHGGFY